MDAQCRLALGVLAYAGEPIIDTVYPFYFPPSMILLLFLPDLVNFNFFYPFQPILFFL
jgi:hypothetical protein